eukprot:COSAG03_NODE_1068_length_4911_cov_22.019534_2_plen_227_part_00
MSGMSSVQYPSRVAIDARATENSELHCCVYLDRRRYTALCRTTDTHSVLCGRLPVRATLTLEIHRQHVRHVVRTISKPRSDRCTGHRENHLTVTDHPLFTKQHYGFHLTKNPRSDDVDLFSSSSAWAPAPLSTLSRPPSRCVSPHARRRARAPLANHAPPPHVLGLDPGYVGPARDDERTRSRHILPRFELLLCLGGQLHHHLAQQRQSPAAAAAGRQAVKCPFSL